MNPDVVVRLQDPRSPLQRGLYSRFGRRLLVLFGVCALVPMFVLVGVSYLTVTRELAAHAADRLDRTSKAATVAMAGALVGAEEQLRHWAAMPADRRMALPQPFVAGEGDADIVEWPEHETDAKRLQAGGATIRVRSDPAAILLRVGSRTGIVEAELSPTHLIERLAKGLPSDTASCVKVEGGPLLGCTNPGVVLTPETSDEIHTSAFEQRIGGERYLGRHRSLFLAAQFDTRSWIVTVAEPRASVLAPLSSFRSLFPAATAGGFLLAVLIGSYEIRRRVAPLRKLHEATLRVAEQDFGGQVEVRTGDELEDVADSFNHMSGRLQHQFQSLDTLIEAARLLLRADEDHDVVESLRRHVGELSPGAFVCVAMGGSERLDELELIDGREAERGGARRHALGPEDRWLELDRVAGAGCIEADLVPPWLHDPQGQASSYALFTLREGTVPVGFLCVGYPTGSEPDREDLAFVSQLVEQTSLAISHQRVKAENQRLSATDPVTGLPNRLGLLSRLERRFQVCSEHDEPIPFALLDLDDFARVNETRGFEAGDRVLARVAERLASYPDIVEAARVGSNQFALVFDSRNALELAPRLGLLLREMREPIDLDGTQIVLSCSAGVAVGPEDGESPDALLQNAGSALQLAKQQDSGSLVLFNPSAHRAAVERFDLEAELRRAIEQDELQLWYQPIVDIETRTIVGAEALTRWLHPERGIMAPGLFIPIAESSSLIVEIGRWALSAAAHQLRLWMEAGIAPIDLAVNLSARQFQEGRPHRELERACQREGVDPRWLGVELTESTAMSEQANVGESLAQMRRMGAHVSIDDFGTGYSSLGYLRDLPVDKVKIDQIFLRGLPEDREPAAICRAIIGMAHALSLRVVAEGVETEAQFAFLREEGCDFAQGFLFSPPVPEDGFRKLLAQQS